MRLIGYQFFTQMQTEETFPALDDIINANIHARKFNLKRLVYDVYIYGFISGKRAERAKRKANKH